MLFEAHAFSRLAEQLYTAGEMILERTEMKTNNDTKRKCSMFNLYLTTAIKLNTLEIGKCFLITKSTENCFITLNRRKTIIPYSYNTVVA